jgi:hypothetical protein
MMMSSSPSHYNLTRCAKFSRSTGRNCNNNNLNNGDGNTPASAAAASASVQVVAAVVPSSRWPSQVAEDHNNTISSTDTTNNNTITPAADDTVFTVVYPYKKAMKQDRRVNTAIMTTTGIVIGGLCTGPFFPIGCIVGGTVAGITTNKLCKHREKRKQRRWEEKKILQTYNNNNMHSNKQNQVVSSGAEFC